MGKINLLSFEVANLIAAGEVVDRPASAIKEMIENSIDAHARHITVEIQNGGSTLMRVSDDGCGMEPEDLPLAIRRHATSKIETAEDLDGICTLGFRGEALAAISAVSRIRIISKTRENYLGAVLEVDCGEVVELSEQGCSDGTTVIVEDLFANVPARRKFLKRDVTETAAICASVERVALSHPEIAFKLITDGQLKLETAGDGKLINAIYAIFGKDFASRLIPVGGEYEGIKVEGYIGRSDNVKGNRNYENFYINNRYIKSKTASAALEQAYSSYIASEKFPVCVLFVSMNPARVDVNVHPAKLEVKFSNEKIVFESVYYAVKQALESNSSRPEMQISAHKTLPRVSDSFAPVERGESLKARQISMDVPPSVQVTGEGGFVHGKVTPNVREPERVTAKQYLEQYALDISQSKGYGAKGKVRTNPDTAWTQPSGEQEPEQKIEQKPEQKIVQKPQPEQKIEQKPQPKQKPEDVRAPVAEPRPAEEKPEDKPRVPWRLAGEVFNSYILAEVGDKMLIIDKHAAHERIIYERLKANMYSSDISSQLLMLPVEVMLMSDEVSTIEEYRAEIEGVGFEFSSSKNLISVTALPVGIEADAVPDMFASMADKIKNGTGNVSVTRNIIFEKALYQASCKAAIKAGREYSDGDNLWIINKLMEIPDITVCPHGRPVAMELSKRNIDRQFERT